MNWNSEDCKKWLPFVQAVADGKKVKLLVGTYEGEKEWVTLESLPVTYSNHGTVSTENLEIEE